MADPISVESASVPNPADLLDLLGLRWRSGKLQVLSDGDAYGLFVDSGRFISATSSHRSLRLGHLLLRSGAVEPVFLHDVLRGSRSVPIGQALGRTLIAEGAVTRLDLARGVEEQCIEVLTRIFALDQATWLFIPSEPLPSSIEVVPLDTDSVIAESTRRYFDRTAAQIMQRLLPPADAPLSLAVRLAVVSYQLTDSELLVALGIDRGSRTLALLAGSVPLDPITLKRTLIGLLERGYVAVTR